MLSRYGSVLIKGVKKEVNIDEGVDVLKNGGLAHDYGKENLQTAEKNVNMKGYVQDLNPETCVEINENTITIPQRYMSISCWDKIFGFVTICGNYQVFARYSAIAEF